MSRKVQPKKPSSSSLGGGGGGRDAAVGFLCALQDVSFEGITEELVASLWQGDTDADQVAMTPTRAMDLKNDTETVQQICSAAVRLSVEYVSRRANNKGNDATDGKEYEQIFQNMIEGSKGPKEFTVLLRQLIAVGNSSVAIMAATTYVSLLTLPGSGAYDIFNPFVMHAVYDLIKKWVFASAGGSKKKSAPAIAEGKAKKGATAKKAGKAGSKKKATHEDDEEEESNDEGGDNDEEGDAMEVDGATSSATASNARLADVDFEEASQLMESILRFTKHYALSGNSETLAQTIETAAELSRYRAADSASGADAGKKRKGPTFERAHKVWYFAYEILTSLLDERHGPVDQLAAIILKPILANITMTFAVLHSGSALPKDLQAIRDGGIEFGRQLAIRASKETSLLAPVHALLQHICIRVPDKADYRHSASTAIQTILAELPKDQHGRFIVFADKYVKNQKVNYRLFGVELAIELLRHKNNISATAAKAEDSVISAESMRVLLAVLQQRAVDKSVNVRAKAISSMADVLEVCLNAPNDSILKQQISYVYFGKGAPIVQEHAHGSAEVTIMSPPPNRPSPALLHETTIIPMLKRRLADEKATVRKAALQVLEMIGRSSIDGVELTKDDVGLLQERCWDPQVAIRKQAVVSLSELFKSALGNESLARTWAMTIPPLCFDTEQTVQERVTHYFEEIVFDNVIEASKKNDPDAPIWLLLEDLDNASPDAPKHLERIFSSLGKENRIPKLLVKSLHSFLAKHQLKGAWLLLAYIAPFVAQHLDADFAVSCWNKVKDIKHPELDEHKVSVLKVIGALASYLDKKMVTNLSSDLISRLERFDCKASLIQIFTQTAMTLQTSKTGKGANSTPAWMANLLKECDSVLASWVLPYAGANWGVNASQLTGITEAENATEGTVEGVTPTLPTVEKLDSYLFTLGEVAQRCDKSKVPRRLVTIVQTIVAPTFKAMKMMVNQSGAFIEKEISIPASTRAHAFVALGKLCLQDPQLAKSCISVFARELETSGSSVVRNNVMVIMCDLTIRYTNLVENYISKLAVCLRDESEMVRRQTLMLLTNLMQEDYIKLKNGSLFFRLIVVLVDDSPSLRQFALSCLESILSKGSSEAHAFYNHFVETIFYLNDYRLHSKYNKFPQTERERALFSFKGAENSQKRMSVYRLFLDKMAEDHKFQLVSKLVYEILNGAVEEELPLEQAHFVIQDALNVLACKEIKMKVTGFGAGAGGVDDTEETVSSENAEKLVEAKGKILNKLVKKNMIENIVPIIIELKHLLAKEHSPLLGTMMEYLKEMMKEYKDEISDILACDKQLAMELDYDLRMHANKQKAIAAGIAPPGTPVAGVAGTPRRLSIAVDPTTPKRSPISTADGAKFSVPKLRAAVVASASAYKPSPAKVRRVSFASNLVEVYQMPDLPSPTPQKNGDRRLSLMSPTLARVRAANITMSPTGHSPQSRLAANSAGVASDSDDDEVRDIMPRPLKLNMAHAEANTLAGVVNGEEAEPEPSKKRKAPATRNGKKAGKVVGKKAGGKRTAPAKRKRIGESDDEHSDDDFGVTKVQQSDDDEKDTRDVDGDSGDEEDDYEEELKKKPKKVAKTAPATRAGAKRAAAKR